MRRDDRIRLHHMVEAGEAIPALLPLLRDALKGGPGGGEP
jgi:hypothetical protein